MPIILFKQVSGLPTKAGALQGRARTLALLIALVAASGAAAQPCGFSPSDWCPPPPGDHCAVHADAAACKADPACYGMAYRGESVVACRRDARGFGLNCPTVGCTSNKP